jgi:Replication protein
VIGAASVPGLTEEREALGRGPTSPDAPAARSREPRAPSRALSSEEIAFLRSDAELRRKAPLAYPVSAEVVTVAEGHPEARTFCDNCSAVGSVLSWCGVRLCVPCWRKQGGRSMMEVARTLSVVMKRRRESGMRPDLRFVTLTSASRGSLTEAEREIRSAAARLYRSRAWRGWVEGKVEKTEVTWNPETAEWHVHLHDVVAGRFIPHDYRQAHHTRECRRGKGPEPPPCDHSSRGPEWECYPCKKRRIAWEICAPGCEPNLRDEWVRATGGRGSVVDVREVDTRDPLAFAGELAKYLVKPFAETGEDSPLTLAEWPVDVRLELARWTTGGTRTVWRCGPHRSMSRRVCAALDFPRSRSECEGRYRKEWVGARRLRWSGTLRAVHRETESEREALDLEAACAKCGKGPVLSAWEVRRRLALGWSLPAGVDPSVFDSPRRLPSIQAHKSTRARSGRAEGRALVRIESARWIAPTDGSGPPIESWVTETSEASSL